MREAIWLLLNVLFHSQLIWQQISVIDVQSMFLNICWPKGGWDCHFQVGFWEGWPSIFCGVCYRSGISGLSKTLDFVYLQWRFDLAAATFLRTANVSRAGHANDERGLHTLWHLSAQNLHFLTISICPSHFTSLWASLQQCGSSANIYNEHCKHCPNYILLDHYIVFTFWEHSWAILHLNK